MYKKRKEIYRFSIQILKLLYNIVKENLSGSLGIQNNFYNIFRYRIKRFSFLMGRLEAYLHYGLVYGLLSFFYFILTLDWNDNMLSSLNRKDLRKK